MHLDDPQAFGSAYCEWLRPDPGRSKGMSCLRRTETISTESTREFAQIAEAGAAFGFPAAALGITVELREDDDPPVRDQVADDEQAVAS